MKLTGKNIIGFDVEASVGDTFYAFNPQNGEQLPTAFCEGTSADVDKAAQLAKNNFDAFRNLDIQKRALFLDTIADEIMALGDALITRTMQETGLPQPRLTGERGRTVNQLKLFAQVVREGSFAEARIDTGNPDRQPLPKPDVRTMQIAIGPVAVFGASNFPLAFSVAGGDTASALAAGCPVIVKGHPAHPGASEMVGRAIQKAAQKCGMPAGVFSLIQGSGIAVGQALVKHPAIKAVGFTGSYRGGKALFDLAAARAEPIPVYAEMGSANPVFILPDALKTRHAAIAEGLANSVTLGAGQFCTNPGLVLGFQGEKFATFVNAVAQSIRKKPAATMLHKGIKTAYDSDVEKVLAIEDVKLVATGSDADDGCRGLPRVLRANGKTFVANPRLEEEVFGPSSILVSCETREEMLKIAEGLNGHLTATIHGADAELAEYRDLISILERKVGRIVFNGFPTGVEVCHAMNHGGPFPATTDSRSTSVGTAAIKRFLRPVCYQDFPPSQLPDALKDENPQGIWRLVDGEWSNTGV